jgi:signal transduction histidine kinase
LEGEEDAAAELRGGAQQARQSVQALRSLLVEIYPPSLRQAGLVSALSDLVAPVAARGIETHVDAPDELDLDPEDEALLFRVAQETVRNAVAHAGAHSITVVVSSDADDTALTVADDGQGFDPARAGASEGHFGLALLRDLARERGAELTVDSGPGAGTRVTIEVPRR